MNQGDNKPCYYCGHPCSSLSCNPGMWPVPLCHADDPGIVKWHHEKCVSERLYKTDQLQQENQALRDELRMLGNELVAANDKIAHCVHIRDANLKMHNELTRLREALKEIVSVTQNVYLGSMKKHPFQIARKALAPQEGKQE